MSKVEQSVIGTDLRGTVLTWDQGATDVYGYSAQEMIGLSVAVLIPGDRLDEEATILRRIQEGQPVENFQTVRQKKSGELIDVSLTISPIFDGSGKTIGASHVANKVADRKGIEHQLRLFAAIVESSQDAIIGKDLNGIVLTWNRGATDVYGYAAHEMIGLSMSVLLPEDRPGEEIELLALIGRGERAEHFETVRRTKSGKLIEVSLTISPINDSFGQPIGASHVARDISDRKWRDQQLRHFASIVESSEDAIISKKLEGTILTWNTAAEKMFGYTPAEAIGATMAFLLPPDRLNEEAEILELIARGERVEHFETVRLTKKGELINVSLTISPVRDATGKISAASHVARNITERKRIDQHLQHTQKLESLGVLAGGVAHDFNNLLTGILANTSLALEILPDGDPTRSILRDVVSAGEQASHLTRQLLAYAGKGQFVVEPLNVSVLVREISKLIRISVSRNVQLRLELRDELPLVEADASQIRQLVMNLILNGAEAIGEEENGTVLVTTGVQVIDAHYLLAVAEPPPGMRIGTYISLEVHDTGCGMDSVTLARIFDPFYTTKFTGRGLGLAAVQGIVRGHNGMLNVYSHPGKGTSFKVLFPAVEGAVAIPIAGPGPHVSRQDQLILVIDDEEMIRRTVKTTLEYFGYSVVLAKDGKEGLELFRVLGDKVSAVLLDLTMPVMNGEETFACLRMIDPQVKVILSSGYNEVETTLRFTGKGLACFLQKPYSAMTLIETISSQLR